MDIWDWISLCCESMLWRFLRKLKIELTYDPAILLLGIHLEKAKILIQKDICTPMFTAALFILTKTRKQHKCPWINEQINILVYPPIYNIMEYYFIKKNKKE